MTKTIVIYKDEGVSEFGFTCLRKLFEKEDVHICNAADVTEGAILDQADLFVMPGGADLPYCKKLNGAGNRNIRSFVEEGGTYLGLCAGAYYGCASIEYHKGREDEICGARELCLIDAVGYGSLPDLAAHYDLTLRSAGIANLDLPGGPAAQAFYHGGCAFRLNDPNAQILARYSDLPGKPPAIIAKNIGQGRAILSGVHFEITPALLPLHPRKDHEKDLLDKLLADYKKSYDGIKFLAL